MSEVRCVPLCAAWRVYGRDCPWWKHEALCPVRVQAEIDRGEREPDPRDRV